MQNSKVFVDIYYKVYGVQPPFQYRSKAKGIK